jgi:hypothetical protein
MNKQVILLALLNIRHSFYYSILSNQYRIPRMTSQRCTASCFESISSTANADLKQPLVVEVQDFESFASSSQEEEQITHNARRRVRTRVLMKSFCFGAFVGLLLQAIMFSAFLLVITKKWGGDPHPEESTTVSFWSLYLLLNMDVLFYGIIWAGFLTALTRKGSLYMRKKFDNDADAPNTESIRTPRFLFIIGSGFLLGHLVGSNTAWTVMDMQLGMPLQLIPLLIFRLLTDVERCCLMVNFFDWGCAHLEDDEEEESESFCLA